MWEQFLKWLASLWTSKPVVPNPPPSPPGDLLTLVNEERRKIGAKPLTEDPRLMAAAEKHGKWMASTGNLSHMGPNGGGAASRALAEGYDFSAIAENIAQIYDAKAAVQLWMNSLGHRTHMLGKYRDVGYVHVSDYWCMVFANPR